MDFSKSEGLIPTLTEDLALSMWDANLVALK